ncbi:MAG: hypothetical protein JNL70_13775 [Saprospiraceae bacterium]|nr:hypothetical protein [Saprospiraceae bacterium]
MSKPITIAPRETIWDEIKAEQAKLSALYEEAGINVYKATEGEAFLGEKNQAFGSYWAFAVSQSPNAVTGEFNTGDFNVKAPLFQRFVEVYNGHNRIGSMLDAPYDVLSKDILRYSLDAKKSFKDSKNAVCKQAVKDAPEYRKPTSNSAKSSSEKAATEKSTAKKTTESTTEETQ